MIKTKGTRPYNNLKGLIAREGLTQEDLAKIAGVAPSSISFKINRKNGRDFTLEEAKKIADRLEVKVDDFF